MKQRDPVTSLLFAVIIPFYTVYWFYQTAKQVRQTYNVKMPSIWLLIGPGLTSFLVWVVGLVVFIISVSQAGDSADRINSTPFSSLIFLASFLVNLAGLILYMYKFCHAIVVATGQNEISPGIMTLLAVAFSPVVVYMVQDKLNQQPEAPSTHITKSPVS